MMRKGRSLGLDELMIVNPGEPLAGINRSPYRVFLGEDGALYEVQGLDGTGQDFAAGEYFLGEDGTLYQVVGRQEAALRPEVGEYFLGDDGGLYTLVGRPPRPSFRR
jgi:hypothetical protein